MRRKNFLHTGHFSSGRDFRLKQFSTLTASSFVTKRIGVVIRLSAFVFTTGMMEISGRTVLKIRLIPANVL